MSLAIFETFYIWVHMHTTWLGQGEAIRTSGEHALEALCF